MKITDILEYVVDNEKGPGSTPNNQDIDYFGFRVLMKPSMFLKLAAPLTKGQSVDFFKERIKNKEGIGSPMLYITVPVEWKSENFDSGTPRVDGHEGRNRMMAIKDVEGDDPVEVHIILQSARAEWRNRHITPKIKDELNKGANKESSGTLVDGPLFTEFKGRK
jgi:hypothetical protein